MCDTLATQTRRLCTLYIDRTTIELTLASRLILLNKCNSEVRPIGVGEVIRIIESPWQRWRKKTAGLRWTQIREWGGVYMRKLPPARGSYRGDCFISYRVCFEGTLHVDKIHVDTKLQTLRMRYPFQSTSRPISHRNLWSFRVYMIPLRDFVPEWNSRPGTTTGVNSRRGDSRRHDILWWYHVNKCRAMRGNRSESRPSVM